MEITITGTKVQVVGDKIIGFALNNLVNRFEATTDKDESWEYQLKVYMHIPKKYNIINLNRDSVDENKIYVDLTRDMMPYGGRYTLQFVCMKDTEVFHTEKFDIWVEESLDPASAYCSIPSEFYQFEEGIKQIYNDCVEIYEQIQSGGTLDIDGINGGDAFGTK